MKVIIQYIQDFLERTIEQEYKKECAKQKNINDKKRLSIKTKISENYQLDDWIEKLKSSIQQLNETSFSLATHIAKGVHSSSKSSNVLFTGNTNPLTKLLVSSQTTPNIHIDINNNNTAVHIAKFTAISNFLNIDANEQKFYQLILADDQDMMVFFTKKIGIEGFHLLKEHLSKNIEQPIIGELDKQLLFTINDNGYHTIFPNYPSSLVHEVHLKISDIKYSEHNKHARELRRNKNNKSETLVAYTEVIDLAIVKLGGTKPLNVSVLNNKRGGRTYLLPSMPPSFRASNRLTISKTAKNFFDIKGIRFYTHELLVALFKNISNKVNNANIRDRRDDIIEEILVTIIHLASDIQQNYPAGWSKDYNLSTAQQYWLDPQRAKLDTQFADARKQSDWHTQIAQDFAYWLQNQLRQNYKRKSHQFGTTEHQAWASYMKQAIAHSQALGEKVFL